LASWTITSTGTPPARRCHVALAGVGRLFRELFVDTGRFDEELHSEAQATAKLREYSDYEARPRPASLPHACSTA
jgi:uncharacterized protein (UPF0332 family)